MPIYVVKVKFRDIQSNYETDKKFAPHKFGGTPNRLYWCVILSDQCSFEFLNVHTLMQLRVVVSQLLLICNGAWCVTTYTHMKALTHTHTHTQS